MLPSNPSNGDHPSEDEDRPSLPEVISSVTPEEEPPATATGVDDRRFSPRKKKLLKIVIRDESNDEMFTGWVLDRSLGGMCLSVQRPLEAGGLLAIRRPNAPESIPWVEMRVRNVREQESTWELGCEYTRTPPWELLVQFE
jgi:hypothetical protein